MERPGLGSARSGSREAGLDSDSHSEGLSESVSQDSAQLPGPDAYSDTGPYVNAS